MKVSIITLFPEMFEGRLVARLLSGRIDKKLIED